MCVCRLDLTARDIPQIFRHFHFHFQALVCTRQLPRQPTHREEKKRRGREKEKGKEEEKEEGKEISSVRKKIVTEVEWGYSAMCAVMA